MPGLFNCHNCHKIKGKMGLFDQINSTQHIEIRCDNRKFEKTTKFDQNCPNNPDPLPRIPPNFPYHTERLINNKLKRRTDRESFHDFMKGFAWIEAHKNELKQVGWTIAGLFRRGVFKYPLGNWGLAWCSLWDKPDLNIEIKSKGQVSFTFVSCGRRITQTASPPKQKNHKINMGEKHD